MFKFEVELPEAITVTSACGKVVTSVPVADIAHAHPEVIRFAVLNGFMGAIGNISRGKDDKGVENSDAVWSALRAKKVDVWMAGTWGATSRSDSQMTRIRDAFFDDYREKTGAKIKDVEAMIKAEVKLAFGDKEKATFDTFLNALASKLAEADADKRTADEVRTALEAKYLAIAEAADKARADVTSKLDVSAITF